jgi:hypothetical protein
MICQTSPIGMNDIATARGNVAVPPSALVVTTDCGPTVAAMGSVTTIVATAQSLPVWPPLLPLGMMWSWPSSLSRLSPPRA